MTCRELAELLMDFIQGELEADLREHIQQHLSSCPPCEVFLETYRITIQLTRHLPATPLPPELVQKLQTALKSFREQEP